MGEAYNNQINIFRAYDIRGIYGIDLNEKIAFQIGEAYGQFLNSNAIIAVGRDIRESSQNLLNSLIDGLTNTGINVIDIGIVPSPVLYFTVRNLGLEGGIMTTASHLPPNWNGFKICDKEGIVRTQENGLNQLKNLYTAQKFTIHSLGNKTQYFTAIADYVKYVKNLIYIDRNIRVTVDYGNSVTALVVPDLLRKLGLEPIEISKDLKSSNPDRESEPSDTSLLNLKQAVLNNKSNVGIAYDGDGDRVAFVDELGNIIWSGNTIIPIFALNYIKKANGGKVICDVTCSSAVSDFIRSLGGEAIEIKVGSGYCAEEVKKLGALFGGQYSGHTSFPEMGCIDDAIFASLKMLEIISQGSTLSVLVSQIPKYCSTKLTNIDCDDGTKFSVVTEVARRAKNAGFKIVQLDGVKIYDKEKGSWVLVRASNTTPLIRVNAEGRTFEEAIKMHNYGEMLVKEIMNND